MFNNVTLDYIYNKNHLFEGLTPGTGLLLIGYALKGPSMTVIDPKSDYNYVASIFGEESSLTRGYLEAAQNGASDIYLLRINGKHTEIWEDGILYRSVEATDLSLGINFDSSTVDTLVITNTYTDKVSTFTKDDNLITNINLAASNRNCEVYAMEMASEPSVLSAGQSETYCYQINERIALVLEMMTSYPIAQIGILYGSFNHKEDSVSLYSVVSSFISQKMSVFEPCIITMGITPEAEANIVYNIPDVGLIPKDEYGGYRYLFLRMQLSEGEIGGFNLTPVTDDKSMYINVVASRVLYDNGYESYYSPMIGAYCGLISICSYGRSTTNMKIPNIKADVTDYAYSLTASNYDYYDYKEIIDSRVQEFSDLGYVVIKFDEYLGYPQARILNGVTHVYPNSSLAGKLMNTILIQSISYDISTYLTDFNEVTIQEAEQRIRTILDSYRRGVKTYTIKSQVIYVNYTKRYHFDIELLIYGELKTIRLELVTR